MWNYLLIGVVLLIRLIGGSDQEYEIGIGIADITGPAAEIGMVSCSVYLKIRDAIVGGSGFDARVLVVGGVRRCIRTASLFVVCSCV